MDNKDFERIYEQYYRPLMLYALSLTKNKHDAEDLAADTFVKAFISYNGSGNIVGWLMTVMKHLFIDDFRRNPDISMTEKGCLNGLPLRRTSSIIILAMRGSAGFTVRFINCLRQSGKL